MLSNEHTTRLHLHIFLATTCYKGSQGGARDKEPDCQCRRCKRPRVPPPGWEDPLEKEMATHSSLLAWEIPWTEEPGGLQSMGSKRVGRD